MHNLVFVAQLANCSHRLEQGIDTNYSQLLELNDQSKDWLEVLRLALNAFAVNHTTFLTLIFLFFNLFLNKIKSLFI